MHLHKATEKKKEKLDGKTRQTKADGNPTKAEDEEEKSERDGRGRLWPLLLRCFILT